MIAISLSFPAGRYHATPWGRHVNEGAVEWPPSPWRLLRALIAAWKRTLPDLSQGQVEPVLRALAGSLPKFLLPAASTGHTRHYMPWFKKGPDDRTLVFDTFVVIPRVAPLVIQWPDAALSAAQRETLGAILQNLNTLGRAESWCEAKLLAEAEAGAPAGHATKIAQPLNGHAPGDDREIVRLLCPDPEAAFADDHVVTIKAKTSGRGKSKQTTEERATLYDPAWNICMETLQLHKERWSDPPGSRWVQYTRPRDCFTIDTARRPRKSSKPEPKPKPESVSKPQVVRFALDSAVLPLITDTLPVAEAARRALMSWHGRLAQRDGVRGRSDVLSGKGEDGSPLAGHPHAYFLPTDEDGDGRLDHLTLVARAGFGTDEMRAIHRLREIKPHKRDNVSHPLRVLLLGYGRLDEYRPPPLMLSRVWVSATPYIATRHARTRGRSRIETSTPEQRAEFLMADLRDQIRAVLGDVGGNAESVKITRLVDRHGVFILKLARDSARTFRPIQFKRFRSRKNGDDGGRRIAGAFRIEFPQPVAGPIALGHSSHFGMGLFVPDTIRGSGEGASC